MAIVDWRVTPTLAVNDPKTMILGPLYFRAPLLKPNSRKKGYPYYKEATYEPRIGMPKSLTAATGMDALTHAIEAYVTPSLKPRSRSKSKALSHEP